MFCKDFMISLVYKCHPTDSAQVCAQVMETERIGLVPVVDRNDKLVGVVPDRDLAVRIVGKGRPSSTPIGEVMSESPLFTCAPDEALQSVESRMAKHKKTRILVVDKEQHCVGIISLSDIAQFEDNPRAGRLLRDVSQRETAHITRP